VIAQGVTFVWLMYYFLKGKSVMRFHIRHLKPDKGIATEAFAIGASSSVRQISGSVLVAILNHTLAIYGGDISIAIFALVNRLSMFALMPAFGVAQGFQPIAGFSYGAKRYDRTKKSLYLAIIVATIITTAGFLVMMLFPSQLIGLFTTDFYTFSGNRKAGTGAYTIYGAADNFFDTPYFYFAKVFQIKWSMVLFSSC